MSQLTNGNLKLYFQLYLELRDKIFHGEMVSGSEFPTIEALQKQYGVSMGTVRNALNLLEKEGLISRKQGNVALVNEDVDLGILNEPVTYEEAWTRSKDLDGKILSKGWVACSRRLETIFNDPMAVDPERGIFVFRVLWQSKEEERRKALMDIFLPKWQVDQFIKAGTNERSIFKEFIQHETYNSLQKVKAIFRPCFCDHESSRLLGLPEGAPLFSKLRILMDANERVLMITEAISTANCLTLTTQRSGEKDEITTSITDE